MMISSPSRTSRAEPRRGLLHVRDHVAVRQHCALGNAGRAAGVLQERDVAVTDVDLCQRLARAGSQRAVEAAPHAGSNTVAPSS